MDKKLEEFLNNTFKPDCEFPSLQDVKQELLSNLQEKFADLKSKGHSDHIQRR